MKPSNLKNYYKERAEEYEIIYSRDDRIQQKEQLIIADELKNFLKGRSVLEIACGTGYWTQILSQTAKDITATDAVLRVIQMAKRKKYKSKIIFKKEDAYKLSFKEESFDAGLANLWLSHIPRDKTGLFLKEFHRALKKGSRVFIADNWFVSGLGRKMISRKNDKNTYQLRRLQDGRKFIILKNYYSVDELSKIFGKYCKKFDKRKNIFHGKHFWYVKYELDN